MRPTTGIALLISMVAAASSHAGMVYINSAQTPVSSSTAASAQAKLRFSNTNFDQSLDRGTGTSTNNFISANLGSNSQIVGVEYHFSFSHVPSQGFVFALTSATNTTTTTLSWGSFGSSPAGTSVPLLNGAAPGASFNGLFLEARASRANSILTFRDFSFTSPTLAVADGSFRAGQVSPIESGPGDSLGFHTQRLIANTDLSQHQWAFTGLITGRRSADSGGDEEVKFTVGTRNFVASIPPVPAPGVVALLSIAGVVAIGRRYR